MQAEEIETLARAGRRRPLFAPEPAHKVELGRADIEHLIPHRDPFLLVDHIASVDLVALEITGTRRIDPADPLFRGHFPGDPIYPGVLQVEIMGQLGLCLFGLAANGRTTVAPTDTARAIRGLKIHHAAFLAAVQPGTVLRVLAKVIEANDYTGICAGQVIAGDTICCFAIMEVYFVD